MPKEEGGLGVIGLKSHNEALMMKKLYKFFNRLDIPMVGIIWEKNCSNGRLPNHVKNSIFGGGG
jgi:hypothetical protein